LALLEAHISSWKKNYKKLDKEKKKEVFIKLGSNLSEHFRFFSNKALLTRGFLLRNFDLKKMNKNWPAER
jgi:hypothetical protein